VTAAYWPADAVEVTVEGGRAWALPDDLAAMSDPPRPPRVRLLPPNDPFLKAGDRRVLVPDRQHQKLVWRVLLQNAEPVGTWRAKVSGNRLEVTLAAFLPPESGSMELIEAEAVRMAAVRGLPGARVLVG